MDNLCNEIEEEIWFYTNRIGVDRISALLMYQDLIINVYRRIVDKTKARQEEVLGQKPYQGEAAK